MPIDQDVLTTYFSAMKMKCLKVDDYLKRTTSTNDADLLLGELEKYVTSVSSGLHCRTLCDRIIRACNHQLGVGIPDVNHTGKLVKLVEVALCGYDGSVDLVTQTTPLYMEKIIFHIVKKLSSLGCHILCCHLAGLLYSRLTPSQQSDDYCALVRSCFAVLWNGLSAAKDGDTLNPRDKLLWQMQALSFLLLLDKENTVPSSCSKAPIYTEEALAEFERGCGTLKQDEASFLLHRTLVLFRTCWSDGQRMEADGSIEDPSLFVLSEVVLVTAKLLCKASHWDVASSLMVDVSNIVGERHSTALVLGRWAVNIHCPVQTRGERGKAFTECARALRSLLDDLGDHEGHAVLEACGLVIWAVEGAQSKVLNGHVLLALFSFLEEHQEQMLKRLQKKSTSQKEECRLQQTLCYSMYKGFVFAYESMQALQLESSETMDRVLLYCQATAGRMVNELRKLPSDSLLNQAVTTLTNLVCGLYNRQLYEQAFTLIEILCQELRKNCSSSLSVDRRSRAFMLAVQSSRRGGKLERALDWVIQWLKALGDNILAHMSEPVSLWVKTKCDAARAGEEDIRLRTLRDGFGCDVPDEKVMLCLLEEELHAYKGLPTDTTQERYNTLCDLLEVCSEESPHTHLRAVYLCEMAQVVCFQDFSEQTDCGAVDFIHEALRLLEEEPETTENADRLKDDKARALLWFYICTLERNLQETIEKEKRMEHLQEQTQSVNPVGTNDLDYEDKQKTQDSAQVYEGLRFNLAAESKFSQPLERALQIWSALLQDQDLSNVRSPKQTCRSICLTAALFKLMAKPLKSLEAYQLALGICHQLGDLQGCASALCHSARLLLDLGATEQAKAQLDKAEQMLTSDNSAEGPSSFSMLTVLLKAQYCYNTGQVASGVSHLCEVLKEVNEQRQKKSCWYLLRALALQTYSSYLSLDTDLLPQEMRQRITQQGMSNPDTALNESLKLLFSLLVTLAGNGLYGNCSANADMRFIDQGDNLLMKWQVLSELLACSVKMVAVRSSTGAVHDAKLQCLEALKLATKLQALAQCAELLVVKAELELMKGETEECGFDLDKVKNLLELCTDFSNQEQKLEVKIKPRKGRPAVKSQSPLPKGEDDCKGFLSTRWFPKETVERDQGSSPPLKAPPRRWLSSLTHEAHCQCPCCSDPTLGRVAARWAATQADLALRLGPKEARVGRKLQQAALARSKSVTVKLGVQLAKLFPLVGAAKPVLMQDVVGRVYLQMAACALEPRLDKVQAIWKVLETGLAFIASKASPEMRPLRAGLMITKAIASLLAMAAKKNCTPEELFASAWTLKPPKEDTQLESKPHIVPPPSSRKKTKQPVVNVKEGHVPEMESKPLKVVAPKMKVTSTVSKGKSLAPKTPVSVKPLKVKPARREFGSFESDTVAPAVACTPVLKVSAMATGQKGAAKPIPRLQFNVYEDVSPPQDKPQAPAAPKRNKKPRFKVEFSDESDSETKAKAELKDKSGRRRNAATPKAAMPLKAPDKAVATAPLTRPSRATRSAASGPLVASSEDEGTALAQAAPSRRCRAKRQQLCTTQEPEIIRAIEEEVDGFMDTSIENLRLSDTEDNAASNFEVLRRDLCSLEKDNVSELKSRGPLREGPLAHLTHSECLPDSLSLEAIQSLLRSAWLDLHHFPPPTLFPSLCALLALTLGQQDAVTTAMLHAQSLGVTNRHHMSRHIAARLRKLKKNASELADNMNALSLDEVPAQPSQRLSRLENIFAFGTTEPSSFPHCQEFLQQIKELPSGLTVCVLSVLSIKPGEIGDTVLLSRLERESAPVTAQIHTFHQQHPISWLVQEMDRIQVEQKAVSCITEKANWWEGRRALDSRVERLLEEMEGLLGSWRHLLLSPEHGHVVLILDKYLQKLPWESIHCLRQRSVTRMPSLHSLLGHCAQKQTDPHCLLTQGVDTKQVFYVLNPDANLGDTQDRFKDWFSSKPDWQGVCGVPPDPGQLQEAVAAKDLYIYVGHGVGARFLDGQRILKQDMRSASMLFGCSSAALAVRGDLEGAGIILYYLMAGCPLILGNLWDVTDRDIDRFTKALLESWLSAGPGSPLLDYMGPSRQATQLKHLIGAAPVVYGLPIHLK